MASRAWTAHVDSPVFDRALRCFLPLILSIFQLYCVRCNSRSVCACSFPLYFDHSWLWLYCWGRSAYSTGSFGCFYLHRWVGEWTPTPSVLCTNSVLNSLFSFKIHMMVGEFSVVAVLSRQWLPLLFTLKNISSALLHSVLQVVVQDGGSSVAWERNWLPRQVNRVDFRVVNRQG